MYPVAAVQAMALSAMYAADHFPGVSAIVSLAKSGHTPLIMSRIRSAVPIFAFSHSVATPHRMSLIRGVQAVDFDISTHTLDTIVP